MIFLWVSNSDINDVRGFVKKFPERINFANPKYVEFIECDKCFIYGRHQAVERLYREKGVPVYFIDYKMNLIPSEPDKEPNENWTINELRQYAKLKGIPVKGTKKAVILDAIINHSS